MIENESTYRRRAVVAGAGAAAALILAPTAWAAEADKKQTQPGAETGTSMTERGALTPMEDLACQHAVARRVLLACQTSLIREGGSAEPAAKTLTAAATMLRSTVDEFHVKLEEDHLFPLFQKTGKFTDLVNTLREQHAAGRRLIDSILQASEQAGGNGNMESLVRNIMGYTRMLQAHTAYEETLLYPQIRVVASDADYDRLQKTLQDASRQKLGPQGFAGLLAKVADLEKSAGITGLAQFTPKIAGEAVVRPTSTP